MSDDIQVGDEVYRGSDLGKVIKTDFRKIYLVRFDLPDGASRSETVCTRDQIQPVDIGETERLRRYVCILRKALRLYANPALWRRLPPDPRKGQGYVDLYAVALASHPASTAIEALQATEIGEEK